MTDIISAADKLACVKRELKFREWVYPRWVAAGKMSVGKKEHELAAMRAIVEDYEVAAAKERLL